MTGIRALTEGSVNHSLLNLAVPTLFANVLLSVNGSVNSIWVGHYMGEAALTATSNANLLMQMVMGAAFGTVMVATVIVGQRVGAKEMASARDVVRTSAALFVSASAVIAAIGLTFSPLVLRAMNTPMPSIPFAITYMRVLCLAVPPAYLYAFLIGVLRSVGDAKTPFCFMLLSIFLDVALNPVLIFGLGPAPQLGIAGSALASLMAQVISLAAMVTYLYRRHHLLCLRNEELWPLKVDRSLLKVLVCKGIPMSGQLLVISLSGVLMISIVNRLGVDAAAGFGAALQLWNYAQMPALAVGEGVCAMAAQNVGAGQWDRVNKIAEVGVVMSLALTGAVIVGIDSMGTHAFAPFLPTRSVALPLAAHLNSIASSSYCFFAISTILFAVERSAGVVTVPLAIMITTLLLVRYATAAVFLGTFGAGAIWWSFPFSAAFAATLAAIHYKFGSWRCPHASPKQSLLQQKW